MNRLLGYMVTKNEADRYLDACLDHGACFLDGLALYDDQSTDETVQLAGKHSVKWCTRTGDVPAFLEHEGRFRQAAWDWFEDVLSPEPGDWVLALDADEFLVAEDDIRARVNKLIEVAERRDAWSIRLRIPEVFDAELVGEDPYPRRLENPRIRTDGFWGKIAGTRLFRWEGGGRFRDKSMGCGAEPDYVSKRSISEESSGVFLMHYGYAHPDDRATKHERYTTLIDHGHNNGHIQSIVQEPRLESWTGPVAEVWRGHG